MLTIELRGRPLVARESVNNRLEIQRESIYQGTSRSRGGGLNGITEKALSMAMLVFSTCLSFLVCPARNLNPS